MIYDIVFTDTYISYFMHLIIQSIYFHNYVY